MHPTLPTPYKALYCLFMLPLNIRNHHWHLLLLPPLCLSYHCHHATLTLLHSHYPICDSGVNEYFITCDIAITGKHIHIRGLCDVVDGICWRERPEWRVPGRKRRGARQPETWGVAVPRRRHHLDCLYCEWDINDETLPSSSAWHETSSAMARLLQHRNWTVVFVEWSFLCFDTRPLCRYWLPLLSHVTPIALLISQNSGVFLLFYCSERRILVTAVPPVLSLHQQLSCVDHL